MNRKFPATIEQYLRSYSAYVEFWDKEAGDTDQLLSLREWLAEKGNALTAGQRLVLDEIDAKVIVLADGLAERETWDALMLLKTADLVRQGRQDRLAA